ncbi:MFS transporter [Rhodococcus sp. IEGM 1408]|uniref:MFS transporter n=1 Tax=Rhodococcus sp. IEGM 1408 TaxID=3082220 RepID=UPI002954E044|nr:MFS transporter [Rhodococcus sp. IEGM 1408]MDV8002559.1 MFS transporter [Rhodococcus sp. IEGM 1408]
MPRTATTRDRTATAPVLIVLVLGFSSMCAALMQSLVIPLQPELPRLLSTDPSSAAWVVTATLLAGGVAMPVAGRLADIRGRKPVLVTSALILLAGSLVCALSSSIVPVLIGRILQGLAMGYIPVAISFVRETVPASMQNSSVAGISATLGVGGALGLPLAAWIAQDYNWHVLFWVSAGLAAVMALLSVVVLPHRPPVDESRLDTVGAIGLAVGVVAVLGGISKGGDWGWGSPSTLGAIIGGIAVLLAWGFYETRHPHPLVDLRTTARRPILLTNIAALLIGFGMMAQSIVVPQLLQLPEATGYGMGQTILQAGLWMAPAGLMMLAFTPVSSLMLTRFGARVTLAVGAVVIAAGYLSAAAFAAEPWQLLVSTCIASAGVGIGYAAMPTLILQNSPATEAGAGVGVNALMRSMGTTIAGAVMALVLTSRMTQLGDGLSIPAEEMFHLCFLLGAGAAITGALVVLCIPRTPAISPVAAAHPAQADEPTPVR